MQLFSTPYRVARTLVSDVCLFAELELLRLLPLGWSVRYLEWRARSTYYMKSQAVRWRLRGPSRLMPTMASREQERRFHLKYTFARLLGNTLLARNVAQYQTLFETEGWEWIERARDGGKGVVLLSTHVGIPSLLRWFLRTTDYPVCNLFRMSVPKRPRNYEERKQLWLRRRHRLDDSTLAGDDDCSAQFMKNAYECLRRNEIVNIAGDGSIGDRRIPAPVFGRQCAFPIGGISLGVLSGAPILPCFCDVDPGPRFRIHIQKPLEFSSAAPRAEQHRMLVEAYARRIEGYLRQYPTFSYKFLDAMFPNGKATECLLPNSQTILPGEAHA